MDSRLKVEGTELVFESEVCGKPVRITARAVACGSKMLPDEMHEVAKRGIVRYMTAVGQGYGIKDPNKLQKILLEQHFGHRIMAKEDPLKSGEPICWWPSTVTIKKV